MQASAMNAICAGSDSPIDSVRDSAAAELRRSLRALIESGQTAMARVSRIEHLGQIYWIKRPEILSWRGRLQKGNPDKAFARERAGYHALAGSGLPIAQLVLEGPDYLVIRDAGVSLPSVLRDPRYSEADRVRAIRMAGEALQQFHAAGVAHGRPNLKDMLWNGEKVTFIDLERFNPARRLDLAKVLDYLLFAFSCFAAVNESIASVDVALQSYRAADHGGTAATAIRLLHAFSRLRRGADFLARKFRSRETEALPKLLDWAEKTWEADQIAQGRDARPAEGEGAATGDEIRTGQPPDRGQ